MATSEPFVAALMLSNYSCCRANESSPLLYTLATPPISLAPDCFFLPKAMKTKPTVARMEPIIKCTGINALLPTGSTGGL